MKKYDEIRKLATGQGDDYITGCLLDYYYFKKNHQLIATDFNKHLTLIQWLFNKLILMEKWQKKSQICTLLEKCKETNLEFYKGTEKVLQA